MITVSQKPKLTSKSQVLSAKPLSAFLMLAHQSLLSQGSNQNGSSSLLSRASTPGLGAVFSLQDKDRHWVPLVGNIPEGGGKASHVPTSQKSVFLSMAPTSAPPPGGVFSGLMGTGTTSVLVHVAT